MRRWLPGQTLRGRPDLDREALARDLASFSTSLRGLPTENGFAAGRHSLFRGCHPSVYGDEVDVALRALAEPVDVGRCREVWLAATTSAWPTAPVWVHGDLDVGEPAQRQADRPSERGEEARRRADGRT